MTAPTQQWSDWLPHDGGPCPIPWAKALDFDIPNAGNFEIRRRNGEEIVSTGPTSWWDWSWTNPASAYHIVACRHIIRPTEAPADGGCPECGGSGKILDRVDGEITCPGCGYPQSPFYTSAERVNETAKSEHVEPSPSLVEAAAAMAKALRFARPAVEAMQKVNGALCPPEHGASLALDAVLNEIDAALALYRTTSKEG